MGKFDFYLESVGFEVEIEYEFIEGDESVGLDHSFEFSVWFNSYDLFDSIEEKEKEEILEEIEKHFKQECEDWNAP